MNPSSVADVRTMEEDNFNRKDLFKKAMDKKWDSVVEVYKDNPSLRRAKVTRTEHTLLHLAVWQKDDNLVEQLVNAMNDDEACDILAVENDSGDTPLHVAAALGLAKICWLLAEKCKELVVSARNKVGETPLYVAVRHGKKAAFFVLQDYVPASLMSDDFAFYRRGDGNTILHAAVHGTDFELAIEIIELYPRLVNFNNNMGQSPLHLLADKPLVFRSGSPPGIFKELLYSRIKVDRLVPKYYPGCMPHGNGWKKEAENKMDVGEFSCCVPASDVTSTKWKEDPRKTVFNFLKIVINILMVPLRIVIVVLMACPKLGILIIKITKIEKTMHERANQVMKELINLSSYWEFDESGKINTPDEEGSTNRSESSEGEIMLIERQQKDEDKEANKLIRDTPILVAAKRGIVEMVANILDTFPIAIEDLDYNHKNIILLSVEHRQLKVYKYMLERRSRWDNAFAVVDKDGNNALHLAASSTRNNNPRVIAGPALQMRWEIRWYKFVRSSMVLSFFQDYNNKGQTAKEIFSETHKSLIKEGRKWMRNTSQSCSVIAILIATVAFSLATTVPGDVGQTSGFPILMGKPANKVSSQCAAAALFCSIISMLAFLRLLTTHYQVWDFEICVPMTMFIGLSSLFESIIIMAIPFMIRFALVMEDYKKLPIYVTGCVLVILIMLPLSVYYNLVWAGFPVI